jgi:hypothetical protein
MVLMSDNLTDRIILEHNEDVATSPDVARAEVVFQLDDTKLTCNLTKFIITPEYIEFSFIAVPSIPMQVYTSSRPVKCTITSGVYMIDFDLKKRSIVWDNVEGKQFCTIVSMIEQQARRPA